MDDFGARLRQARERKGISLGQIAKATKIPPAALDALERNDLSRLPGGIFSRSFVRSYARQVGLDPEQTLQEFLAQSEEGAESPDGAIPHPGLAMPHAHDHLAVDDEAEFESRQKMASVVLRLVLISLPIAIAVIYVNSRAASPRQPGEGETPLAAETMVAPAAIPASERAAPDVVAPASIPGASSTAGSTGSAARAEFPVPARGETIDIEIAPSAECWVQLTVDGRVAVSRLVPPGDRERHTFTDRAVLKVGDAGACTTFLNGRAIRPLGRAGQVRTVTITPDNYAGLIP
jgi:cytoskeleton protein RodZ